MRLRSMALAGAAGLAWWAIAGAMAAEADLDYGKQVFKRANCVGCHKWHGGGGGGYGGAALSLRATQLDRDQIIEVVRCGRPGTGMPFHAAHAYSEAEPCYGMTDLDSLGSDAPSRAAQFLNARQIEGVVDYVLARIKGRGEPTHEECADFWGAASQNCRDIK